MDAEPDVVTLLDEAGRERRFRLHDAFEVGGSAHYLVEEVESPDVVMILHETESGLEALTGPDLDRVLAVLEQED